MAGAVVNDHIMMVSRNGKQKAVPIWQIKQWMAAGLFVPAIAKGNEIGYDFADPVKGAADLRAFEDSESRKRQQAQLGSGLPEPVDQGIAEVHFRRKPAADAAFTSPPVPGVGEETIGKEAPKAKPKDVI